MKTPSGAFFDIFPVSGMISTMKLPPSPISCRFGIDSSGRKQMSVQKRLLVNLFWAAWLSVAAVSAQGADTVIAISIDGMGSSYMQKLVDAGQLPRFKQLEAESAWTANARNDFDNTVTLPNHTCMMTGRPVLGPAGHHWTRNTDPAKDMTIHSNRGFYVASVFDVAHDNGKHTGLFATKSKFSLFAVSYDALHGAPAIAGSDDGRNKLDMFVCKKTSPALTDAFLDTLSTHPCQFALVHFTETDSAGHTDGWGNTNYNAALVLLDACVGRIMDFISTNTALKGKTTLIVTTDHGGKGFGHGDPEEPLDYTIPFFVWGADATAGDLYAFNPDTRRNPGVGHPNYSTITQPVRNGEVGNLALKLLGLGPIPGSTVGAKQDLRFAPPGR